MQSQKSGKWARLKLFRTFAKTALSSKRSYGAIISTGLSSLANFAVSISIARSGSIEEVAYFAIGFAGFLAMSGLTRAMISEPSAARLSNLKQIASAGGQVSLYALFIAAPMVVIGLLTNQFYLAAVGFFGHAIALYDYSKFSSTVFGRPVIAVFQELFKVIGVVIALLIPSVAKEPHHLFLAWLITIALAGYIGSFLQRIRLLPSFSEGPIPFREAASYAMDYVLGAGTTQISTFALGAMAPPSVNASLRGTATLLGPITTVATSIRVLIIPYLARKLRHRNDLNPAANVALSLIIIAVPLTIAVNFIPEEMGEGLLGATWHLSKTLLPILSLELLFNLLTQVPFAGHRSLGAHRRTLLIRTILAPLTLLIIIPAGAIGGYVWAAIAMLGAAVMASAVWWFSYFQLMKTSLPAQQNFVL